MMVVIAVHSTHKHADRMRACRDTWIAKLAKYPHVRVLFVLADPAAHATSLIGDTLYVPTDDDRGDLWRRTLYFLKWALEHTEADYFFKCDDDTFISAEAFANYDHAGRDYIGGAMTAYPGFLSGGAGYFLSRHAATLAVQTPPERRIFEDLNIGKTMTANGIVHSNDPRFIPLKEMRPVTVHYASPREMYFLNEVL